MAKHQRRWLAPEQLSQPYHDDKYRQSHYRKFKLVTKSNSRTEKKALRSNFVRKNRTAGNEGHHVKFKNHTYSQYPTKAIPTQSAMASHAYTPDYYYIVNATEPPTLEQIAAERERIRVEFFSTYDAMTGVRIATTLGGFFGLMVFLVIYKSRGERIETMKALKDPKIAAVAAAVMQEEEDRELQEALEASGLAIYPNDYIDPYPNRRRTRMMSLGNVSAPPTLNQCGRFSSIGGYNSLLAPTRRRFSYAGFHRKSNSVESSRVFSAYPIDESFDYYTESGGEEADDEFDQITNNNDVGDHVQRPQLSIPKSPQRMNARESRRRCSNVTCCSSESSYLERRCSAITLGLSPLPAISSRCISTANIWDFAHHLDEHSSPPDMQLAQSTVRVSPNFDSGGATATNRRWTKNAQRRRSIDQDSFDSASTFAERNRRFCYDEIEEEDLVETTALAQKINKLGLDNRCLDDTMLKYTLQDSFQTNLLSNRRAPLASISSLKISSIDYQDSSLRSPVSDSLFEETYADTDDDLEPFSLDSDENMETHKYTKNGQTIARTERSGIDASTSVLNKSIAMQTSYTRLNMGTIDSNQETICEIDEIGPQFQQNTDLTYGRRTVATTESAAEQSFKMGDSKNLYTRSTGNMIQECASNLDKNQFLSEPLNLHLRTTVDVDEKLSKIYESNFKLNSSIQKMPIEPSYCNSSGSSRNSSNCINTT